MNEQPEALRLADAMQHYFDERGPDAEAVAAELRRLHEANEEFAKRQKWWNDRMFEMEAALRQAQEPRQWQGLTDEEIKAPIQRAMQYFGFDSTQYNLGGAATVGFLGLVKEIEARLKEKNT